MPDRAKCIPLNGAPSQYDRFLRFEEDSVRVDDRSEAQLLAFPVEFGRLLRFYNLHNDPDGDWSGFFLSDPTIALASLVALDLQGLQAGFTSLEKSVAAQGTGDRKAVALAACFQWLLDLALQFNGWLAGTEPLLNNRSARMFSAEVRHVVTRDIGPALRSLKKYAAESPAKEALAASPLSFSEFLPVWGLGDDRSDIHDPRVSHDGLSYDEIASALRPLFLTLLGAAQRLREYALRQMADTLNQSDHQPPAALYIAFVHLFRIAQRTVNQVASKFARFYYIDILRSRNFDSRTDSVYLTASVKNDFQGHAAMVTRGTRFSSIADPATPSQTYEARADAPVSSATLDVIRTIRVVPGSLCGGENSMPVPTQIIASQIDVELLNLEAAGKAPNTDPFPWPTFGASLPGASPIAVAGPAAAGIAIASPYLMLTGGERTIAVTFTLAPFSAQLTSALDELATASALPQTQIVQAILAGAFDVFLSTSGGWFEIPYAAAYTPSSTEAPAASFSITLSLAGSAPQVLPFDPPPDAIRPDAAGNDTANPAPLLPTAKFRLRQTSVALPVEPGQTPVSTYPLSTLRLVEITSIAISTTTDGLTDLTLQNTNGPVDTSSPFPLFGSPPVVGSFLRASNPELFVKLPASLELAVEWYSLPADDSGFHGYYQDYRRDLNGIIRPDLFNNTTFRCWIDVRKPGLWQVPDPDPEKQLYLFTTLDGKSCAATPVGAAKLCPVSSFPNLTIQPETPPPFYDASETALQLTLTAPAYGFGNLLYAPNVLNAVIDDLPPPTGSTSAKAAPDTTSPNSTGKLRAAADSLSSLSAKAPDKSSGVFGRSSWFTRSAQKKHQGKFIAAVQEWQANLVSEVQRYLQQNLIPLAGADGAQVQALLSSAAAGTTPSEKAQALDTALKAAASQLPPATAGVIDIASLALEAVTSVDQAVQKCDSQEAGQYRACIQSGFGAIQTALDEAFDSMTVAGPVQLRYPNPPWLPQAKSVSVTYTANCNFPPSGTTQASFCYLLPFGGYQLPASNAESVPLLFVPEYPGQILLGVSSLEIPQTLNILFQMVSGGHRNPPSVFWEHLEQTWTRFRDSDEPADTTNDLQQTGVVSLLIPAPSAAQQTIAPADRRWLRAVVAADGTLDSPDLFPETTGIYLNPILADRVADKPDDPAQPTRAHTIKKPADKLSGVGDINQPSHSFGGRAKESYGQLRARQAERLRHKDRAILPWDYERLVLQAFPDIWKVAAIPATGAKSGGSRISRDPGHVLVVVVAGPSAGAKDPTKPLATVGTLEQISQFLAARASIFARICVVNPNYVGIHVDATVSFAPGEDPGAGIDKLNSDLVQYLSPWFYDEFRSQKGADYASQDSIIQFVVTRSYIAALSDIRFQYAGTCEDGWCFYTSAPKHKIRQSPSPEKPVNQCG